MRRAKIIPLSASGKNAFAHLEHVVPKSVPISLPGGSCDASVAAPVWFNTSLRLSPEREGNSIGRYQRCLSIGRPGGSKGGRRWAQLTKNEILASYYSGVASLELAIWWADATLFFPLFWTYNERVIGCAQPGGDLNILGNRQVQSSRSELAPTCETFDPGRSYYR